MFVGIETAARRIRARNPYCSARGKFAVHR